MYGYINSNANTRHWPEKSDSYFLFLTHKSTNLTFVLITLSLLLLFFASHWSWRGATHTDTRKPLAQINSSAARSPPNASLLEDDATTLHVMGRVEKYSPESSFGFLSYC